MLADKLLKPPQTTPTYIEDVFSTYLYTGNGSTQTITNGIDLSTKGGLVWIKDRNSGAKGHALFDTARGVNLKLQTQSTNGQFSGANQLTAFNATGFDLGSAGDPNGSGTTYASWTFRKQTKFFDVVTFTGDGTTSKTISHSLGSTPGCIIVKRTDSTGNWTVWHTSFADTKTYAYLNTTAAAVTATGADPMTVNSTSFTVGSNQIFGNGSGWTYVAYIYAHNAGGFGLTGTDNVISCGSFTTNASYKATVNLGYEPQWILTKQVSGTYPTGNWRVFDTMRGWTATANTNSVLYPNLSDAEGTNTSAGGTINSTGFVYDGDNDTTYIYIAIRRGPMKVPTDATKFYDAQYAYSSANTYRNDFTVDAAIQSSLSTTGNHQMYSRLTGNNYLSTNLTSAETANASARFDTQTGFNTGVSTPPTYFAHLFRRAPSFFDEVCYTGNATAGRTVTHNLGVTPEMIIVKNRSGAADLWIVYTQPTGASGVLQLADTAALVTPYFDWGPTSTTFKVGGTGYSSNNSGINYVAYLFATCAGVSKVGSYTGNGSTQTINCGFAGGARFVLIKRTDSTGGWYVYDTARGMTTLTDPYLFLNSTAAEAATLGSVTTVTTGFAVNASILAAINTNAASYVFFAVA